MGMFGAVGFIFGMIGMMFGLIAYSRVDKLEQRLKELGVLEHDFKSEEEI